MNSKKQQKRKAISRSVLIRYLNKLVKKAVEGRLDCLEGGLRAATDNIVDLSDGLEGTDKAVGDLENSVNTLSADLQEIEGEVRSLVNDSSISDLERKVYDIEDGLSEIDDLSDRVEEIESKGDLDTLRREVTDLEESLTKLDAYVNTSLDLYEELKKKVQTLQQQASKRYTVEVSQTGKIKIEEN